MASLNSHSFCSSVPFYHIHIYMTMKIFSCYEFNFAQNWLPNSPTSENDFQNLFRELHTLLTFSRWTLRNLGRHLIFVTFSTKSKHVRWYESFIVYCILYAEGPHQKKSQIDFTGHWSGYWTILATFWHSMPFAENVLLPLQ